VTVCVCLVMVFGSKPFIKEEDKGTQGSGTNNVRGMGKGTGIAGSSSGERTLVKMEDRIEEDGKRPLVKMEDASHSSSIRPDYGDCPSEEEIGVKEESREEESESGSEMSMSVENNGSMDAHKMNMRMLKGDQSNGGEELSFDQDSDDEAGHDDDDDNNDDHDAGSIQTGVSGIAVKKRAKKSGSSYGKPVNPYFSALIPKTREARNQNNDDDDENQYFRAVLKRERDAGWRHEVKKENESRWRHEVKKENESRWRHEVKKENESRRRHEVKKENETRCRHEVKKENEPQRHERTTIPPPKEKTERGDYITLNPCNVLFSQDTVSERFRNRGASIVDTFQRMRENYNRLELRESDLRWLSCRVMWTMVDGQMQYVTLSNRRLVVARMLEMSGILETMNFFVLDDTPANKEEYMLKNTTNSGGRSIQVRGGLGTIGDTRCKTSPGVLRIMDNFRRKGPQAKIKRERSSSRGPIRIRNEMSYSSPISRRTRDARDAKREWAFPNRRHSHIPPGAYPSRRSEIEELRPRSRIPRDEYPRMEVEVERWRARRFRSPPRTERRPKPPHERFPLFQDAYPHLASASMPSDRDRPHERFPLFRDAYPHLASASMPSDRDRWRSRSPRDVYPPMRRQSLGPMYRRPY